MVLSKIETARPDRGGAVRALAARPRFFDVGTGVRVSKVMCFFCVCGEKTQATRSSKRGVLGHSSSKEGKNESMGVCF